MCIRDRATGSASMATSASSPSKPQLPFDGKIR
jgi:hypothetical protein